MKTVYDPSPFGYKLPEPAAFSAFTSSNVYGKYDNGYTFYTKPSKQGSTILVMPLGYATYGANNIPPTISYAQGGYFTSGTYSASTARLFYYVPAGSITVGSYGQYCVARTIWPVADD